MLFSIPDLIPYTTIRTSRSGGKGGQNVNKVSTKVELYFDLENCSIFLPDEKTLIKEKLSNRLSADGLIQVKSEEERSQYLNKERAFNKLHMLLKSALYVKKPRKATKPKRSSIEQRLKNKQFNALKKLNRKGGFDS
jgi:ribosome-associated protein